MPYRTVEHSDRICVHKENSDKTPGEQKHCYPYSEGGKESAMSKAKAYMRALYAAESGSMKVEELDEFVAMLDTSALTFASVKVAGDWELDVLGNPYGPDSDGQWFDENTQFISGTEIPVVYYHSFDEDGKNFAQVPIIVGKAINPTKKSDGTWWRVVLDKTVGKANDLIEAAKRGAVVASSGAIEYLSRIEINGKLQRYSKSIPGRIAVWAMGELSLWENDTGKRRQAHPYAVAVPAMKAIYEQAGLTVPEFVEESENDEPKADDLAAKIAKKNLQKRARFLISTFDE